MSDITHPFEAFSSHQTVAFDDENDMILKRITNSDIPFLHLLSVQGVALSDYYLYIADTNGIHSVNLQTNEAITLSNQPAIYINTHDNQLYILRETGLYRDADTPFLTGNFLSFSIYGGNIYLASRNTITIHNINQATTSTINITSGTIRQISASNFGVFVQVSLPQLRFAIYRLATNTAVRENTQHLNIPIPYAIHATNHSLLILTQHSLIQYTRSGGILIPHQTLPIDFDIRQHPSSSPVLTSQDNLAHFSTYLDNIYALDLTDGHIDLVVASGSRADFFFNRPSGISYRFGNIIVSDTYNDRISLFNRYSITHSTHIRPISAVMTHARELIIAYSYNRLINRDTGASLVLNHQGYMVTIQKIIADRGNIYVIFEDLRDNLTHIIRTCPLLEYYTFILSGLTDSHSLGQRIGGGTPSINEHLIDFFIDYGGNIFGINTDGHFMHNSQVFADLGVFTSITFVTCDTSGLADFNDILLLNKDTHSLFRLSSNLVIDITTFYTAPSSSSTLSTARQQTHNSITSTNINTPLFSAPTEKNATINLPINTQILIRREIPAPPNMYFVVAFTTDMLNQPLMACGFIYRAALMPPLPFVPPANTSGQVIFDNTHIRVFPSVYSHTYTTLRRGDLVRVLDFVSEEINDRIWFRIATSDNTEGFMLATSINTGFAISVLGMTSTNATLRQDAMLLVYLHGVGRVPLEMLPSGTRILIDTPFDSASRYTRVLVFIDDELAEEIEVFIATRYIDFDGVDIWMIVLIVGIIFVTIILVILGILMAKRRKRIMPYGQYMDDNHQ